MKLKTSLILCLMAVSALFGSTASAQVTYQDYLRADAVMSYADHVYSAAVTPNWLGESHYFWYRNHEKDGDFFYLEALARYLLPDFIRYW